MRSSMIPPTGVTDTPERHPMPPGRWAQARWWAVAAACVVAACTAWQACQVTRTPYPASYDYDEGVYAETAAAWAHGATPYRDVFLSQPPAFIAALRVAFLASGTTIRTARATAIVASMVWLAALFSVAAAVGRPRAGLLALCAAAGNFAFSLASHTVQTDAPSEALSAAAVALAVLGSDSPALLWTAAGAVWGLAVLTKLTAVVSLVPLAMIALTTPPRARRPEDAGAPVPDRGVAWRLTRLAALGLGTAAAVASFLPTIRTPAFLAQAVYYHLGAARALGSHPAASVAAILGFLVRAWPMSAAAALGGWASIGAVRGVGWFRCAGASARRQRYGGSHGATFASPSRERSSWLAPILLAWLVAGSAALAGLTPLWPHHLLLLVSPLALLAGLGIDAVLNRIAGISPRLAVAVATCTAAAATAYVVVGAGSVLESSSALRDASEALARAVPAEGLVVTDDPMVPFLADRRAPPALIDTSLVRIQSRDLTEESIENALSRRDVRAVVLWRGTFRSLLPRLATCAATLFPIVVAEDGPRRVLARDQGSQAAASAAAARCHSMPAPGGEQH